LHISLFKYVLSTMGVSKESISKFLIGNRFYVKSISYQKFADRFRANKNKSPKRFSERESKRFRKTEVCFRTHFSMSSTKEIQGERR